MNVAISTLIIRRNREGGASTCLLHWRDPAKVGHAGGLSQVIPVGIFQASGNQAWNELNNFSLWRCIVREIAEELLGRSEDHGSDTAAIDYAGWPLARALQDALDGGRASAVCLGMGTDPLTLATDLLTAVVIDDEVFDTLFAELVSNNAEGHLSSVAVPFDREAAERFGSAERMQAAGVAALLLGSPSASSRPMMDTPDAQVPQCRSRRVRPTHPVRTGAGRGCGRADVDPRDPGAVGV